MSLVPSSSSSLSPFSSSTTLTDNSGGGGTVLVEKPACGYWVDGSGYPALNGIYVKTAVGEVAGPCYKHNKTDAHLKFVPQGWLLQLADGTDCFLQFSQTTLMVNYHGWQAIDSDDADPLAEPPDEVVALLDESSLADLIAAQRAHEEAWRRHRAALLPPKPPPDGAWWRVAHSPAVVVRKSPSTTSAQLGLKLFGEHVFGLSVSPDGWLKVHSPTQEVDEGFMLIDGKALGMGTLLERLHSPALPFVREDAEDADELAAVEEPYAGKAAAPAVAVPDVSDSTVEEEAARAARATAPLGRGCAHDCSSNTSRRHHRRAAAPFFEWRGSISKADVKRLQGDCLRARGMAAFAPRMEVEMKRHAISWLTRLLLSLNAAPKATRRTRRARGSRRVTHTAKASR